MLLLKVHDHYKPYHALVDMSLQFDFPSNLTTEKFIAQLSDKADVQLVSRHIPSRLITTALIGDFIPRYHLRI